MMKRWAGYGLAWYETIWVMLPCALVVAGGMAGGAIGGLAVAVNVWLMRRWSSGWPRYALSGGCTAIAVLVWLVAVRQLVLVIGPGPMTAARIDQELAASPPFVALQHADADSYARMRSAMTAAAARRAKPDEVTAIAQQALGAAIRKYLPHASDEAVLDFARMLALEIDQIGAKSADACVASVYPQLGRMPAPVNTFITPEVAKFEQTTTETAIRTGASTPVPVPGTDSITAALGQVRGALIAAYGAQDVAALARPETLPHAQLCAMNGDIYKHALMLPKAAGVPLLRFLFAQSKTT